MRQIFELSEIAKNEIMNFSGSTCVSWIVSSTILYVNVVLEKF